MKYIFIYTNNYIYCSYLTKPAHTPEILESLKGILSENDDIKLLIPEVVELEFYKVLSNKYDNINSDIQKFIRDINKVIPDYLEDEKSGIIDEANGFLDKRSNSKKAALEIFEEIIEFENVIRIPLNSDIILNSHKRRIREVKPSNGKHNKDADCMILESLRYYLKTKTEGTLIFCSNNPYDFANSDKNGLHEEIKNDFNIETKLYLFLYDLLQEEFEKEINETEIEDIKEIDEESKITSNQLNLAKQYLSGEYTSPIIKYFNTDRISNIMNNDNVQSALDKYNEDKQLMEDAMKNYEEKKEAINNALERYQEDKEAIERAMNYISRL